MSTPRRPTASPDGTNTPRRSAGSTGSTGTGTGTSRRSTPSADETTPPRRPAGSADGTGTSRRSGGSADGTGTSRRSADGTTAPRRPAGSTDGAGTGRRATGSTDRLGRLLNLVPYLMARPGIRVADAAADLGVSDRQLREDLELLWVCGLPGYGPGDLIDMALDGDTVTITYDAGIDRPLRLTPDEALALVVALRMLAETPGVADRAAIERALAKIESAAGDAVDPAGHIAVRLPAASDRLAAVQSAVERRRALRLTYYSARRDATTERVVDPMRVLVAEGRSYLEGWCRTAGAVRMFRVDRIDALVELDEPAAPPPQARPTDVTGGVFQPTPDLPLITLRVGRGARWITEYYPCERVVEESGDHWLVSLRAGDLDWARRLVLGLGPEVDVVSPPALVDAVGAEARAALDLYA